MIHTGLIEPIGDLKSRVEASLEKKFCLWTASFAHAQTPGCPVDFTYLTSLHSRISQCFAINLLIHLPLTGAVSLVEPWYRLHRILLYGYLIIYLTNPPTVGHCAGWSCCQLGTTTPVSGQNCTSQSPVSGMVPEQWRLMMRGTHANFEKEKLIGSHGYWKDMAVSHDDSVSRQSGLLYWFCRSPHELPLHCLTSVARCMQLLRLSYKLIFPTCATCTTYVSDGNVQQLLFEHLNFSL